jgi:hypothetical protein
VWPRDPSSYELSKHVKVTVINRRPPLRRHPTRMWISRAPVELSICGHKLLRDVITGITSILPTLHIEGASWGHPSTLQAGTCVVLSSSDVSTSCRSVPSPSGTLCLGRSAYVPVSVHPDMTARVLPCLSEQELLFYSSSEILVLLGDMNLSCGPFVYDTSSIDFNNHQKFLTQIQRIR